jgi:hypothetical protein
VTGSRARARTRVGAESVRLTRKTNSSSEEGEMEIKDNQKTLWAAAYEEARGWGFDPKGAWEHADRVVAGY